MSPFHFGGEPMRHRGVIAALCLMVAPSSQADEVVMTTSGCKAMVSGAAAGVTATWSGACRDGKIHGIGSLLTDDGTRLDGEFEDGVPLKAHGVQVYRTSSGRHVMTAVNVRDGQWFHAPLPADRKQSPAPPGLLEGEWDWQSLDGKCRESHRFTADSRVQIRSGGEILDGFFELLTSTAGGEGVYEVRRFNVRSNGQPDCMGAVTALGEVRASTLRFIGRDRFLSCATNDEASCFGEGRRAPALAR